MKAGKKNSTGRFRILLCMILIAALYIFGTALHTMLPPTRNYWLQVSKRFTKENQPLPAARGNLYDCKGRLVAGSVPEYRLYLDFNLIEPDTVKRKKAQDWRDSVLTNCMDSISTGLAQIFPDKNAKWFKNRLLEGMKKKSHAWRIYPKHASYIQFMECKKLPLLRESTTKGGFYSEIKMSRKKPYGSAATRTFGDLYRDSDAAKFGLELSFDSILRGKPGKSHIAKVRNRKLNFVDIEPENGHDLQTTIDVDIQDQAEKSIVRKLEEIGGETGIVIVMEVATGDVKAIVNMTKGKDGNYYEMKNNAVSDLMEPGSTFKTASIMVGLEDGKIKKSDIVDCTGGKYKMYGRWMNDHNWRKGGYGVLTVPEVLQFSSNIGVSRLIDKAYHDHPEDFVKGLKREGVGHLLDLPFQGKGEPIVPEPKSKKRYWSKTDLPWMSIGYVTQLPPISTLTFYNAIANGGKMVKPRFIKAELVDGTVVKEFPTETLVPSICKPTTLADIQEILESVVSKGLGKKAGNGGKYFRVSGKTGTAQIAKLHGGGYHSGTPRYMVSFCGYFPSEKPQYSCIVCIVKDGLPASGGGQCGPVFSEVSQYIMAKGIFRDTEEAADSLSVFEPSITKEAESKIDSTLVPNLVGMGAKDAVYLMQGRGMRVRLNGWGSVKSQDIPYGATVKKGKTITLQLE